MNRTPEQWAALKPDAFLGGSIVQARNVIEMMQQDIATLVTALRTIGYQYENQDLNHVDFRVAAKMQVVTTLNELSERRPLS